MVTQELDGSVEFRFYRPFAGHAALVGEFNGWDRQSMPMTRGADGWWRYRLRLPDGCYQFRYFCDGEWFNDHAAFGIEHTPLGINSVVRVERPEVLEETRPTPSVVRLPHVSEQALPAGLDAAPPRTIPRRRTPQRVETREPVAV